MSTVLIRRASQSLNGGQGSSSLPPGGVLIRRHDTGAVLSVPLSEIRYGRKLREGITLAWGLTSEASRPGDTTYIRMSPDSRWCVRVDVIPDLSDRFRYALAVPPADSSEVAA